MTVESPSALTKPTSLNSPTGKNVYQIDFIYPEIMCRIVLISSSPIPSGEVIFPNAKDRNLEVRGGRLPVPTLWTIVQELIPILVIYILFTIVGSIVLNRAREKNSKEHEKAIEESNRELAKTKTEIERLESAVKDTSRSLARYRTFLYNRIEDYSRELSFWRSTVKEALLSTVSLGKGSVENLFVAIRLHLGTSSTATDSVEEFRNLQTFTDILYGRKSEHPKKTKRGLTEK